jgi:DNA-binding GntR family transcriptional regulator
MLSTCNWSAVSPDSKSQSKVNGVNLLSSSKFGASSSDNVHRLPRRLSDEAASYIRELVVSGQLIAEEFIRPEAIAERLGISATPVREGMLRLQSEGFLGVVPRRGFVVLPLSPKDISDAFEAQALLAGELCSRTAGLLTLSNFNVLQDVQNKLEVAAKRGDLVKVEELNFNFHRIIYHISDAPKIQWLLNATLRYAPRRFYATIGGWPEASTHDHRAILSALQASDGDAAREAMVDHIRGAGWLLAKHLAEGPDQSKRSIND